MHGRGLWPLCPGQGTNKADCAVTFFVCALVFFIATHLIPGIKPLRRALIARFGKPLYLSFFSAASLLGLGFVGWTYTNAPYIELWPLTVSMRWLVVTAMGVACFLVICGMTSANPFSLGIGARRFNAQTPGIVKFTRHPLLWGLFIWSVAHLFANGDVASFMLFGLLSLLGALGPWVFDRRTQEKMGVNVWARACQESRNVPVARALMQVGALRPLAAAGFYLLLVSAHGPLIGVSPLDGLQVMGN